MSKYNFKVQYWLGRNNANMDSLSRYLVSEPTGATCEEKEEDETPNSTLLCPKRKSVAVKVDASEDAGWLGRTALHWSQSRQVDSQVRRVRVWVARGHVPTGQE